MQVPESGLIGFNENSILAHGAITDIMKKGTEQGIFIDEHPAALADILWATYAGVILWVYLF